MSKISVIIPSYNRQHTIERALRSVFGQTWRDWEIIVVDDASTDNTYKAIEHLVTNGKIKYIRHTTREGAQAARITGIKNASGEYIAFLDSDDELLPNSLESRLKVATVNNSIGLIYGDVILGDRGEIIRFKSLYGHSYTYLLKELSLCPYSAMMIKKECFEVTGYPNRDFTSWQDDDMVLTIGKHFPVFHCGQPVAIMHSTRDSLTKNKKSVYLGCRMMVSKYRGDIITYHGRFRLYLWYLRILRSWIVSKYSNGIKDARRTGPISLIRLYLLTLKLSASFLTRFLLLFFDHIYG